MEDAPIPSLSEVARTIYWAPGLDIEDAALTKGLLAAELDPTDQKERTRLRKLVMDANVVREEDSNLEQLDKVAEFVPDARKLADDPEDVREAIFLAQELAAEWEAECNS